MLESTGFGVVQVLIYAAIAVGVVGVVICSLLLLIMSPDPKQTLQIDALDEAMFRKPERLERIQERKHRTDTFRK